MDYGFWVRGLVFTIRLHRDRRFLDKRGGTCIYVSGAVKSPCLAGLIPAVYLTEDVLQTDAAELILSHELTHLRHLDFLWSLCRAVAVSVYWWNPLIWLAAICSKRDAELACDEAVAAKLPESKRLAYARAILAQAPRKTAALSLAGPPIKERILFLTKKRRTSVLCVILALLLVVSATGCSFAELTQQKSEDVTMLEDTEAAHQEALKDELKTATPLTQEQIDAVNAVFADYERSTDDTLGHFAVNGFFTSTYDDVRELNLNNFLTYFGECGGHDISEEEFAQLNAKWEFRVDSVADFPLPIHRYPASAVEGVLRRFAGIGLADLKDIQESFSDYTYLEETDAFYNTTSDYSPGYFICSGGEIEPGGDYALLYGSAVGRLSGDAVLSLTKDGENWYIHSFSVTPAMESATKETGIPPLPTLQTVTIRQVRDDSITVEHIVLLNSYLEEDLQTLKDLNIPPEEYQYGYYRKDSGEIYTYDVDPGTPVTIYDISQEYGAGEDRLYTFETWQEFVSAVQANERLLIQPYVLTIQNGVVTKLEEKFYN